MDTVRLRRRLARGRAARLAALPTRVAAVAAHNGKTLGDSARWLATSREHTNFTYNLTSLNEAYLAWYVATVTGAPVGEVRGYLTELAEDTSLRAHLAATTQAGSRRGLADTEVRYGRRAGWYALVRACRPERVVETGTDKGLGACVLAAALLRNGVGRLTTVDVNAEAGYLVAGPYAEVTDLVIGDSLAVLASMAEPIDLFLHDSDHSAAHEAAELAAVTPNLSEHAMVLSDNGEVTDELMRWAEATGRQFLWFDERPDRHWWPGGGIATAYPVNGLRRPR